MVETNTLTPAERTYAESTVVIPQSLGHISSQQVQYEAEKTYGQHDASEGLDAISIDLAESDMLLDDRAITSRFELDHVVKIAPRLSVQLQDQARTNTIEYLANRSENLRSQTSSDSNSGLPRASISEADGLREINIFLENAIAAEAISPDSQLLAKSIHENLTYIGTKEYIEATNGIATYWKALLNDNPSLQLYAVAGKIAADGRYTGADGQDQVKSDSYMLDSVLNHFTDEELERFKDRLVLDDSKLNGDVKNTRVVLLDDWAISGTQLTGVVNELVTRHPELEGHIEVQLIAATAARIKNGTLQAPDEDSYESERRCFRCALITWLMTLIHRFSLRVERILLAAIAQQIMTLRMR